MLSGAAHIAGRVDRPRSTKDGQPRQVLAAHTTA